MGSTIAAMSQRLMRQRFFRFLLAGGLAALCNFGSRFFYSLFVDFSAAVVFAFMTGLTVGYLLNKLYVFTTSANSPAREITWFVVINLLALAQTWGLSVYLSELLQDARFDQFTVGQRWSEAGAHLAGVLLPVFTSYVGHRYLTFRE